MKKKKRTASRILAAALSTAFTISFVPVSAFAEQATEMTALVTETGENVSTEEDTMLTIFDVQTNESGSETPDEESAESESQTSEEEQNIFENYQVHINVSEDVKDVCCVTLNDSEEEISVQENDSVKLKIEISDIQNKHCQIGAIKIGDTVLFKDATGQTNYENTLQITGDMADETGNVNITIELIQYYIVQFSYNSEIGTVTADQEYTVLDESDPTKIIGTVQLNQDEKTVVTATPAEYYRVSEIIIDNKSFKYSENDYTATAELEENQNHIVKVIFELNQYQASRAGSQENGKVTFCVCDDKNNFLPENYCYGGAIAFPRYGQTLIGCVNPDDNSYISSIRINGELYQGELTQDKNGYYLFYVENVQENQQIEVNILKHQSAWLTLSETDNAGLYYSSDVVLKFETDKTEDYPDFQSGEYWIEGTDERFPMNISTMEIVVPKEINRKDIVVCAEITDIYGHTVTAKSDPFTINSVEPKIRITIAEDAKPEDYQSAYAETGHYWTSRTATILIDDRADTFPDYNKLLSNFKITKNEQELSNEEKLAIIQYDKEHTEHLTSDGIEYDRVTVSLYFREGGEYRWSLDYKNLAGMSNTDRTENGENIYQFAIDKTAPTGSVTVAQNVWNQLLGKLTFGIFNSKELPVTIESEDFSEVKTEYYISQDTNENALTWSELETIDTWTEYSDAFSIKPSGNYVIYARLTDASGNRIYLSSDGHIIDNQECNIELTSNAPNENGIYNNNINFQVKIEDKTEDEDISSGIRTVEYWVTANGEETQHEVLYQFETENPTYDDLVFTLDSAKGEIKNIVIDAEKNNSYNAKLYLKVTDNAGNEYVKEQAFKIDITAPEISVSYDNNIVRDGKYFDKERTATISITENYFNSEDVVIEVNGDSVAELVWHDNTTKIEFQDDGEYHLEVSYTDKAGNSAVTVSDEFVIDKTNPVGSVTIKENTWDWLLEKLTFGIFSNEKLDVTIKAEDVTSGIEKKEYYLYQICQDEVHLPFKKEDLEQLPSEAWKIYDSPFSITKDTNQSNIVYVRITDNAGNVSYLCSDGYIFDDADCKIKLTPDNTNARISYDKNGKEHVYYHDDVDVEIKVTDCFPYSGIKSVKYWVTVNGEETVDGEETIHETYEAESEHQETDKNKSCDEWTENIKIPYNSSDVVLHVKAEDYAGNITSEKLKLDIDKTAPQIEISYDNNNGIQDTDERYYFKDSRTATIKFTERENHFSREDAINSILIMDIYKGDVSNTFEWGEWQTIRGTSENHDDDTHTITIRYFGDANYHFDISYTDKAGNKNSSVETGKSVAPYNFTVDMTAPYGIVTAVSAEGRMQTWDSIVNPLSFGFWSKSSIQLSSETWDLISPVKSVEYYKSFSTTALTEEELRNVGNWKNFDSLNFASNEQCTVYLKITDMAGNSAYISTNALIVDDNAPYDEMIPPDISMTAEQAESGIYNNDVTVSVVVNEPLVNDAYSGLKTISYRILNMGQETESGTLYTFDSVAPQYSDLLKTWEGEITVSSEANNSNDVVLEIYAQDNALNSSVERLSLSIDTTPPEIAVSFDNNNSHDGLFKSSRTARISIRERNFSKDFVNISATRNNAEYTPTVVWTQSGGTENGDNTIWYADVPFSSDGDYTFSVACTDLAANKSGELQYADDTVLPSEFTVDATSPKINVVFTDEDTSPEGIYYKASRIATITIDELHFNKEKATKGIAVKGNNDGESINAVISNWKDNDNIHTATVTFSQDAKYHLSVAYTDEAGNAGTNFNTDFYIDNIDPELNISVNDKEKFGAYGADSEEVLPVIQYKDANFDAEQVTITLSGINVEVSDAEVKDDTISFTLTSKSGKSRTWTGKFEDITDNGKICGKILKFEDFPSEVTKILNNNENDEKKILEGKKKDKEFDDIYTFSVSVKDKSGRISNSKNLEKNSLTFSVNRTGSTYDTSEIESLLEKSVQESPEVVISEINPNNLKEYSVILFKNNEILTLEKGKDYDVSFTGKETEGYQYTYKIYQSNFEDDGVYSIILHSEDKAGNISENTFDTKDSNISFVVDKTPPTAAIANLKDDETYYVDDKMAIIMSANDNLKLTEVRVYLDDDKNIYHQWNEQEIEQILKADSSGEFIFEIEAQPALSSQKHNLTVICKDASGRENEPYLIKGFRIIYNESVKPLIYTGVGGAAVLIIGTVVVIARRRKK